MSSIDVLQTAIQAAREGRKVEARDLLIKLVEADPQNETAWMWLAGLVDSLEDRIIACENVLTINPANEKIRAYLEKLQQRQKSLLESKNRDNAIDLLNQAKAHVERNEVDVALRLANQALEKHDGYEEAWLLVGRLSSNVDRQIQAFEKAYQLNPSNKETASTLEQLRHVKANPMSAATRLEQLGQFEDALNVYHELASRARNSKEFDHIYKQIIRIERLQNENIRYVAPSSSILRLTFAWPLLYLSLALVQMGLNPFAHPSLYLWLGLPLVVVGSFLLSLAEVRSTHIVWQKLFDEQGDGSQFARLVTATAGWFFIMIPHIWLVLDSLNRLRNFKIPPMPF
jgi:tetratricopeptide (TPR) repeat protein